MPLKGHIVEQASTIKLKISITFLILEKKVRLRNKVRVLAYIFLSVLKYNRRTEDEA
jgi:hypothetical protein